MEGRFVPGLETLEPGTVCPNNKIRHTLISITADQRTAARSNTAELHEYVEPGIAGAGATLILQCRYLYI